MTPTTKEFVVGLTSSLWATIYRKRKNHNGNVDDTFDLAAEINQKVNFDQYDQDQVVKHHFRQMVDYIIQVKFKLVIQKLIKIKAVEQGNKLSLKELLTFALQLQINLKLNTTQHDALECAIETIVTTFKSSDGITAKSAVVNLLEATFLIPGVFNLQMLSWRARLQDIIHIPSDFVGFSSLQYPLPLDFETANDLPKKQSVATQTRLTSPNSNQILEFQNREFELKWTLSS